METQARGGDLRLKTVGLLRKTRHRGRRRVSWMFIFGLAVYNLVRIRNLAEATG